MAAIWIARASEKLKPEAFLTDLGIDFKNCGDFSRDSAPETFTLKKSLQEYAELLYTQFPVSENCIEFRFEFVKNLERS